MRDELNVWTETSKLKIMKNIVFIGNFNHAFSLPVVEALFLVKSQNSTDLEISNLILNACLGEAMCKMFVTREKLALS